MALFRAGNENLNHDLRPVGFDLDMTLIDSRPQILAAYRALSEASGVPIDIDEVLARLGVKLEDELRHWFAPEAVSDAAAGFRWHYRRLADGSVALPGAREALAFLQALGVPTMVVTAKHSSSVEPCLRATGLVVTQVFTFVHGPEKAGVLRRRGAATYVGDTPDDMRAAATAGAHAVGVATGSFSEAELRRAGASLTLSSLEEFPSCYESLCGER